MTADGPDHGSRLEELAARFDEHRPRLTAIAQRALGSPWAADDAVQETWLRLHRADAAVIGNLQAWLTTVVSRVCIDLIRQRERRHEDAPLEEVPDPEDAAEGPDDQALRHEELGLALSVMLERLGPRERLALVLHDVFALPFDEIAPMLERSPTATRQLASRARSRLRTVDVAAARAQREGAIEAFLAASREGDFGALLQLLDPEIEVRGDEAALALTAAGAEHGAPLIEDRMRGRDAVARAFAGRAALAAPMRLRDGVPVAAYVPGGAVRAVYLPRWRDGLLTGLDVLADPAHLAPLLAEPAAQEA
ncbi:sigma-70 family RNA polymerase sigma factor [Brachybacterium sp. YJGR34]|uniref:sigma-70 family RNA polymerase sigma factor n=1 Tax=Brachybacterium sp. YJGR34 TaxID=2059911 RepID=UPI000E0C8EC0|nr:sigma-70 family RNA polymerase sigma factor [Brachybacterium sp. YJGR34]